MEKNKIYRYNPSTDNFERIYPTLIDRLISVGKVALLSLIFGTIIFLVVYYGFSSNTETALREENARLRTSMNALQKRVDVSLKVMDHLRNRDDNFYRVMLQAEPMSVSQRYAGLERNKRRGDISVLTDVELIGMLENQVDLLDRQIYSQIVSFDEIKELALSRKDRLAHIPGILPIHMKDYTMSSGYGVRRDPIYGSRRFHEGLDFAAPKGTSVFATADGTIMEASRKGEYGNMIDISHGYNYLTRYAHLSEILVKEGQKVKRGEMIGKVGSTGKSTGSHLHYEVRFKDQPQNPVNYYFLDLSPEEYAEMIRLADDAGHVMD